MTGQMIPALLALLITLGLTPAVTRLALRAGLVEYPSHRRIHRAPRPLGGGIAHFAAFWLALVLSGNWTSELWGLFVSSAVELITGLIDDMKDLSPGRKFAGQTVAALILIAAGTRIEFVTNPFGGMIYLSYWSIPITLFWLLAITNLINFMDGLDGLAAGVVAIACGPMVAVAVMMERPLAALLAVVLAGSALGFLPYNFNPARIFMGDAGALFLGFMLGAISVEGALKGPTVIAIGVSTLALGLHIVDNAFAILRRLRSGRPFYQADMGHVHHRLLALGYTQRQVVVALYAVSAGLSLLAHTLLYRSLGQAVALFTAAMTGMVLAAAYFGLQYGPGQERDRWAQRRSNGGG